MRTSVFIFNLCCVNSITTVACRFYRARGIAFPSFHISCFERSLVITYPDSVIILSHYEPIL
ncbi:hypothetical protein BDV40DRAFT_252987 [Aspergillus tamarii]|uniref:Uncharacterized protein n=1 Tax=Aspergillus tamarii TaxID=41984 RepID=A0A5N6V9R5_ASPTM|nr:hypothetical protein BDV40DRAFT_252987 [Aspergillus tamarii]